MRLRRQHQQPAPPAQPEADLEPELDELDEAAELLSDLVWDEEIRSEAAARAKEASARFGGLTQSQYYPQMLNTVARERGVPPDVISRRNAEAHAQLAAYQQFIEERGIDPARPDAVQAARDTLAVIEKRRFGLELRLKDPNLTVRRRQRCEAELERLDQAETQAWTQLHPPVVAGEPGPRDEAFCRCGRGMTKADRWTYGWCDVCRNDYEQRTGQPWRAIL